jgi:putative thioredoxin
MASEYEVKNFEQQVIDDSHYMPVMVDFWASWCGPCIMLEPIIIQLAEENKNRVKFVKVNTDDNPELANRYNIMSIPAIRIFNNGEVVAAFNGLMYKPDFEKWLDQNLPDSNRTELINIKKRIEEGYTDAVRNELKTLVEKAPQMLEAKVLLATFFILDDPQYAAQLVSDVQNGSPFFATADSIRNLVHLQSISQNPGSLENGDGKAEIIAASAFIRNKELAPALESLLTVVTRNRNYHNGIADKALVSLFSILGNNHPLTKEYQERYDLINV